MTKDITQHKYLFHHGKDYRSFEFLGAHPTDCGIVFRVWAPRAKAISVVGSFNGWDSRMHPLCPLQDDSEIWEITVPEAQIGDLYKFAVTSDSGQITYKADPYAFYSESGDNSTGSQRASIVYDIETDFPWNDQPWLQTRAKQNPYQQPMNIYEVHLGSWRRRSNNPLDHDSQADHDCQAEDQLLTYRQAADELIPYVKDMGYTHIELLPVMEHPFNGSWGYQITGYYSPTARYGRPEDLKYFIDLAHQNGIAVIMDWVPAHFPKDDFGLVQFDGHSLYEDSNPLRREHRGWGTLAFDYGRPEVISFLISNAFYYCEQFHVDGLRVDAVAAMIYLNYDREEGQWMPNEDGGVENKEAVRFLQQMNHDILSNFPGVITIAEESTAWAGITLPPQDGGLGFNFKWNMGWMNDELEYFSTDPIFRSGCHGKLIFSLDYAWSENYILPISHDEVVHGKKSLLDKMPGSYDQKFHGLRAFLLYMFTHPGKKLTFMGTEFAQFIEWNENAQLDWLLLDYDRHRQAKDFCKDLNHLYAKASALWAEDTRPQGFQWIDGGNVNDNVIAFLRLASEGDKTPLAVCLNLSGRDLESYKIGVPDEGTYLPLIDTDQEKYGGSGLRTAKEYCTIPESWNGYDQHIVLTLPALSGIILQKLEV